MIRDTKNYDRKKKDNSFLNDETTENIWTEMLKDRSILGISLKAIVLIISNIRYWYLTMLENN